MNAERIEIGDTVRVNINAARYTLCAEAVVLYLPVDAGDSWIFREVLRSWINNDIIGYNIHYVSEGCSVVLISKKEA